MAFMRASEDDAVIMEAIRLEAIAMMEVRDRNLAIMIANNVGKLFKRG